MGAGLAARALAARARDRKSDVDGGSVAERSLGEIEVDNRFRVGCAGRTALAAAAEGVAAEERVEQVAEPERIAAGLGTCGRARAVLAEDVVAATPLGIAQRLVRLARFLEARFRVGIVGIVVGVETPCQRAVRALDLVVARGAGNAEDLVVVGHESAWPSCWEMASTAASACR